MSKFTAVIAVAIAMSAGCAQYTEGSASGDVISQADAAKTVVLHVDNQNPASMELRTIVNGQSLFIGSVGGNDSTDLLLDSSIFPTGFLYLAAIPADGHRRAIVGPLSANKGDRVIFSVSPDIEMSHAIVAR